MSFPLSEIPDEYFFDVTKKPGYRDRTKVRKTRSDKGRKHATYRTAKRKVLSDIERTAKQVTDTEAADARRKLYLAIHERNFERRLNRNPWEEVDTLIERYKGLCPICGQLKLNRRQWHKKRGICRGCAITTDVGKEREEAYIADKEEGKQRRNYKLSVPKSCVVCDKPINYSQHLIRLHHYEFCRKCVKQHDLKNVAIENFKDTILVCVFRLTILRGVNSGKIDSIFWLDALAQLSIHTYQHYYALFTR